MCAIGESIFKFFEHWSMQQFVRRSFFAWIFAARFGRQVWRGIELERICGFYFKLKKSGWYISSVYVVRCVDGCTHTWHIFVACCKLAHECRLDEKCNWHQPAVISWMAQQLSLVAFLRGCAHCNVNWNLIDCNWSIEIGIDFFLMEWLWHNQPARKDGMKPLKLRRLSLFLERSLPFCQLI